MLPVVAAVTVGQTPREDIVDEMRVQVPQLRWIQLGALDEVDEEVLARLAPRTGEFPLVTRMRGGRPVLVGEQAVLPFVQRAVDRVASDADLIVVLCSTPLRLESPIPVLFPDPLLAAAVAAFGAQARIAVLTPNESQIPLQHARWRGRGFLPEVFWASPYGGTDFRRIGEAIRHVGASVVVLDCIAYSSEMRAAVATASGVPTLLVRSLVASLAEQAAGASGGENAPQPDDERGRSRYSPTSRVPAGMDVDRTWPALEPRHSPGRRSWTGGAARLASELRLSYFLGVIHPGDRLPSVRELARRLHVSPTTAAEWYRVLHERGLVSSRMRSGLFVKCPDADLHLSRRDVNVLRVLQRAVHHLDMLGQTVRDAADLLHPCLEPASSRVTFGCLLHRELYEVLVSHLRHRLGFSLPMALLACHESGYETVRRLASDCTVRCLLATPVDAPIADRLAGELRLGVIALQLDPKTATVLRPPACGTRCIVTRDRAFAGMLRTLTAAVQGQPGAPRVRVTSLADPAGLEEAEREGDEIYASPPACDGVRSRLAAPNRLRVLQVRLADQTIDEILFRYLVLARNVSHSRVSAHWRGAGRAQN